MTSHLPPLFMLWVGYPRHLGLELGGLQGTFPLPLDGKLSIMGASFCEEREAIWQKYHLNMPL